VARVCVVLAWSGKEMFIKEDEMEIGNGIIEII
jgi:hypothetical protein